MYLENQESVREKSGKSQGISFVKVCGNPELVFTKNPASIVQCFESLELIKWYIGKNTHLLYYNIIYLCVSLEDQGKP